MQLSELRQVLSSMFPLQWVSWVPKPARLIPPAVATLLQQAAFMLQLAHSCHGCTSLAGTALTHVFQHPPKQHSQPAVMLTSKYTLTALTEQPVVRLCLQVVTCLLFGLLL